MGGASDPTAKIRTSQGQLGDKTGLHGTATASSPFPLPRPQTPTRAGEATMARTPEEIVSDFARSFRSPTPTATRSLDRPINRLPRPAASHGDWRGLPSVLISALFLHLPVPDIVRLGYLFTPRWRELWRGYPLSLHDRQFASVPIPRSEVANAITNVLEEYLHGLQGVAAAGSMWSIYSFRVESTEWIPEHAERWCAALTRGGAREIVLFNRGFSDLPAMLVRVPHLLLDCTSVWILHLGFFTVEPGELDALTETMDLGLYGCACRGNGVVEGVVSTCRELCVLSVHDGVMDTVVVSSAPLLWCLSMRRTLSRSLTESPWTTSSSSASCSRATRPRSVSAACRVWQCSRT